MEPAVALETTVTPTAAALAARARALAWSWARQAATFGSAGSMVLAACVGAVAFVIALSSTPMQAATPAPTAIRAPSAPAVRGPLTDISAPSDIELLAPVGTPPGAAVETALDYDVVFFWPATPQTVAEPVAIRAGPAARAHVIRSARPGERLRINGRVASAPNGPWLRVRLETGQDGYFAARTMDVGAFRRQRAADPANAALAPDAGDGVVIGAPLTVAAPEIKPDADTGPPAF